LCAKCVPTAQMSVDVEKAAGILIDKMANKNTPSTTAREYKQEPGETAKLLFIGSIPIAASNLLNNLPEADNGAAESITEK
jgi:hypothetical protein